MPTDGQKRKMIPLQYRPGGLVCCKSVGSCKSGGERSLLPISPGYCRFTKRPPSTRIWAPVCIKTTIISQSISIRSTSQDRSGRDKPHNDSSPTPKIPPAPPYPPEPLSSRAESSLPYTFSSPRSSSHPRSTASRSSRAVAHYTGYRISPTPWRSSALARERRLSWACSASAGHHRRARKSRRFQ